MNGSLCQRPVNTEEPTGLAYVERDGQQLRKTHQCSLGSAPRIAGGLSGVDQKYLRGSGAAAGRRPGKL